MCHPHLESLEDRRMLSVGASQMELFNVSPALFVENQGQWTDQAEKFVHSGDGVNVAMTDAGPVFHVFRPEPKQDTAASEMTGRPKFPEDRTGLDDYDTTTLEFSAEFVGANAVTPVGLERAGMNFNYFLGEQSAWRSEVPSYEIVAYEELYDGIDLRTRGQRSDLKYEFHVAPGADYTQIAVRYDGIAGLALGDDGQLVVDLGGDWGQWGDDAPYIYQEVDGQKVEVAGQFELLDERTYSFDITGAFDPAKTLVIDPVLTWATYLGGNAHDAGYGVAVDDQGSVLVTGRTESTNLAGANNSRNGGDWDAFVLKVSSVGELQWATYLGGSGDDDGYGIAVDGAGNALVTGETNSTNFAGANNAHQSEMYDAFLAKVSSSGVLQWATYLGGSDYDFGYGVAVDAADNALVTGMTDSGDLVGVNGVYAGAGDAFVAKVSRDGVLQWTTYLGGSDNDNGNGIATDNAGNVLVTGETNSNNFVGANNALHGEKYDAFVAKVSSSGVLQWATYLGGSDDDFGYGVAVDAAGHALVTGETGSSNFAGANNSQKGGYSDAFAVKVSSGGTLQWATYLGGSNWDHGYGIAVDDQGDALVTGSTESTNFAGANNAHGGWIHDAFVVKVASNGVSEWATYLGGSGDDLGYGVAADGAGNALVAGETNSINFTGVNNQYKGGSGDAFVAKLDIPSSFALTLNFKDLAGSLLPRVNVPWKVTVRLWEDRNEIYDWPPEEGAAPRVYEFGNPGLSSQLSVAIPTVGLTDGDYVIDISATQSGADHKLVRITLDNGKPQEGQATVTLTRSDVREDRFLFPVLGSQITYKFVDWAYHAEEQRIIEEAVTAWESSGEVSFVNWDDLTVAEQTIQVTPNILFSMSKPYSVVGTGKTTYGYSWVGPSQTSGSWRIEFANDANFFGLEDASLRYQYADGDKPGWRWFRDRPHLLSTALHEIGHALGLRYPTDTKVPENDGAGNYTPDNEQWSTMVHDQSYAETTWLSWSDVASRAAVDSTWRIAGLGSIDIEVADPLGKLVTKEASGILDATYLEEDLDGDGDVDDMLTLLSPVTGQYFIRVIPAVDAEPDETVMLFIEDRGERRILLDDVRIADLPAGIIPITLDRTPPALSITPDPIVLSPVGSWVTVQVAAQLTDDSDPHPQFALAAIMPSWETAAATVVRAADTGLDDRAFDLFVPPDARGQYYMLTYMASDAAGNVSYAATRVFVGNAIPEASEDIYRIDENETLQVGNLGVLSNDASNDGDGLRTVLAETTKYGQLDLREDGSFTYTPNHGFNREDSFSYRATDGVDVSQPTTVWIIVDTAHPWHNGLNPLNVNDDVDGLVSPIDALLIINALNSGESGILPLDRPRPLRNPFYDANRDGYLSPIDALLVINRLNRIGGEGEADDTTASAIAATPWWPIAANTEAHEVDVADVNIDTRASSTRADKSGQLPKYLQSLDLLFAKLDDARGTEFAAPVLCRGNTFAGDLEKFLDSMLNGVIDEEDLFADTVR